MKRRKKYPYAWVVTRKGRHWIVRGRKAVKARDRFWLVEWPRMVAEGTGGGA